MIYGKPDRFQRVAARWGQIVCGLPLIHQNRAAALPTILSTHGASADEELCAISSREIAIYIATEETTLLVRLAVFG
jgi:hypothetical protein